MSGVARKSSFKAMCEYAIIFLQAAESFVLSNGAFQIQWCLLETLRGEDLAFLMSCLLYLAQMWHSEAHKRDTAK